jgi:serine/threonine protein kinase
VPATDAYTKAKYNVGSPLYMSPEAYRRSEYSIASDVWGIGVIFYEMIIGGTPFKGMDYDTMVSKVQSGELFSVLQLSPISKGLLSRMMCVDVKQRMSIDEVLAVLEKNKPNSSQLRAPSPMRALSPMRSELKQQRSGDNMLLPQNNGSQLRQRSVMNSMENSPIKMLPAAHSHIQEK